MRTPRMDERGIALVVAILALVVIGALVAGTFFLGRLEQRIGTSSVYVAQASEAADAGLAKLLDADQAVYDGIAVGSGENLLKVDTISLGGGAAIRYTPSIERLNNSLFLVRSIGERIGSGGAVLSTDKHGMLVRLERAIIGVNSAITIMQPVALNGNAFAVSGINSNPPGWETTSAGWNACPPVSPGNEDDKVGIRSATSTGVGGKDGDNIDGYPVDAVSNDSTITSATFHDFVDKTFATMTKQPGVKTLPLDTPYNGVGPVVSGGVCDKTSPYNFGEPTHPSASYSACYNYFPIVSGTASQTKFAAGSRGQGTLLVQGDLEINGGFEWTGLIIVRGSFKINGTGNKITGAVMAESVTDNNTIGGDVTINYSSCAINKAVQGAATPAPLGQRAWMQLY